MKQAKPNKGRLPPKPYAGANAGSRLAMESSERLTSLADQVASLRTLVVLQLVPLYLLVAMALYGLLQL